MADEQKRYTITPADVERLAGKLEEFTQSLPEQDRAILAWIIDRAGTAPTDDTTGHLLPAMHGQDISQFSGQVGGQFGTPFASRLGKAIGLGDFERRAIDIMTLVR